MAVSAALSPSIVPDAATAPVVSIVPPSHAPATSWLSPISSDSHGMIYIIGMAHTSTSDITYDRRLLSPLITPQVAIAADTPHILTALERRVPISRSTPIRLDTQNEKYHTNITTSSDCISP